MSTYPRLQGKKGKKLQEKRKKQHMKKLHIYNGEDDDKDRFMDIDYEDSIFIPDRLSSEGDDKPDTSGDSYKSPSLKKYNKVGIDGISNFYEEKSPSAEDRIVIDRTPNRFALDSSSEESENESNDEAAENDDESSHSEDSSENSAHSTEDEEDSDKMPLPTFLLEKHSTDRYGPVDYDSINTVLEYQPKLEHKTKKVFAKAKKAGIMRAFQLLINNEFIQSFSFTPIPASAPQIRNMINALCEKFDLLMHTEKEKDWYFITIAKPMKWTKKNITKAKRKGKGKSTNDEITSSPTLRFINSKPSSETISMQKTLMEGLSTPISSDNKGSQLLKRMGWEGGSLGQQGDGIVEPVGIHIKRDNKGIGASDTTRSSGGHTNGNDGMCFVKSSGSSLA